MKLLFNRSTDDFHQMLGDLDLLPFQATYKAISIHRHMRNQSVQVIIDVLRPRTTPLTTSGTSTGRVGNKTVSVFPVFYSYINLTLVLQRNDDTSENR
jgi:hypothetical protein